MHEKLPQVFTMPVPLYCSEHKRTTTTVLPQQIIFPYSITPLQLVLLCPSLLQPVFCRVPVVPAHTQPGVCTVSELLDIQMRRESCLTGTRQGVHNENPGGS